MKKAFVEDADCIRRTRRAVRKWAIEKKYCEPDCSAYKAAEQMGMSVLQLNWYCRVHLGKTYNRFRMELRIREAVRLVLKFPGKPFSLIGEAVGIPDKSNFRRDFRKVTGMTPDRYRRRFRILRFLLRH